MIEWQGEYKREMNVNILEFIRYITWFATECEEVLSPIRLVKFLYLADLYYARRNEGRTLTGWPWKFVHYGPFCGEALRVIDDTIEKGMIAVISYESKFDDEPHFLYKCESDEEPSIASSLPFYVIAPLQAAIKRWAGDTYALLDHVYFETEPMINVSPGDVLDFSKAKEPLPYEEVRVRKLSRKKVEYGKELISKLKASQKECLIAEPEQLYDEHYYDALEYLDGHGLDLEIEGEAIVEDSVKEAE